MVTSTFYFFQKGLPFIGASVRARIEREGCRVQTRRTPVDALLLERQVAEAPAAIEWPVLTPGTAENRAKFEAQHRASRQLPHVWLSKAAPSNSLLNLGPPGLNRQPCALLASPASAAGTPAVVAESAAGAC